MRARKIGLLSLFCICLAAAFLSGAWVAWHAPAGAATTRKIHHWVDPMHPSYTSDRPGIAPDCGMALEPVYEDGTPARAGAEIPPGALHVSPERQQTMGITMGIAERTSLRRSLRTVGRVAADENRVYRLVTAVDGWVNEVFAGQTGAVVSRNQVLLHFYSREFLSAQAAYFYALDTRARFLAAGQDSPNQQALVETQIRTAAEALTGFGMDALQLAEIARTKQAATDIVLRSPTTGYIVARNVYPRQRFDRGTELYRIVDVSRVWIVADLIESDAPYVRTGTTARVSFPYQQQGAIDARVGDTLPQFDPATRTFKIRLEAANPSFVLRPDMLVDVELGIALPDALTVPADAVVDSGGRKTVFIDRQNGYFEPRRVQTGWRFNDRVQIVKGLMAGDRIARSGNFLLDSESRMQASALGVSLPESDPVCGMDVDRSRSTAAGRTVNYHGESYFFCSDDCRARFEATPAKYADDAADEAPAIAVAASARPASADPRPADPAGAAGDRGIREAGVPTAPAVRGMTRGVRSVSSLNIRPSLGPLAVAAAAGDVTADAPPVTLSLPAVVDVKTAMDPVTGMQVEVDDATAAHLMSEYKGRTYYFVSRESRELFDKQPDLYLGGETADAGSAAKPVTPPLPTTVAKDPVCGMTVDATAAKAAGRTSDYQGHSHAFCSDGCKTAFDKEPAKYIKVDARSGGA